MAVYSEWLPLQWMERDEHDEGKMMSFHIKLMRTKVPNNKRFMNFWISRRLSAWTPWTCYNLGNILTTFLDLTRYNCYLLRVWLQQVLKYLSNANPEFWTPSKIQLDLSLQLKTSPEVNCHTVTSFSKAKTICFILLNKDLQDIKDKRQLQGPQDTNWKKILGLAWCQALC